MLFFIRIYIFRRVHPLVSWSLCRDGQRRAERCRVAEVVVGGLAGENGGVEEGETMPLGSGGRRGQGGGASAVALQDRRCHGDGEQEGEGARVQRDARSGGRGGVGRTAVGARGHGGGVEVGGGVPPRRGVCAVLGDHLSECREEEVLVVSCQSSTTITYF